MPRVQIVYDYSSSTTTYGGGGGGGGVTNPYYQGYSFGGGHHIIRHGGAGDLDFFGGHRGRGILDYLEKRNSGFVVNPTEPRSPKVVPPPTATRDPGPPRTIQRQATRHKAGDDDFSARLEEQRMSGELFEDPDFPADMRSIYPSRTYSSYEWKRPKDICSDPQFISDGASRFDVKQGELGDCWLLAAIASLSLHRDLFEKVVPVDQTFDDSNYCGMFRFRFWQFGEWRDVVIDDRLPTKNGRLCFMKSQDRNEFWSALLEKAYAKLNGSYEALAGGNQCEAMEDFTGGLSETFNLESAPENLYEIMRKANKSQSLMGCSIESDEIEGFLSNGLITGHAYSVTNVRDCELSNGDTERLVRVRNPWGNECEWKGDWSDNSARWNLVSDDEKESLDMEKSDDGEFWMSFDDFSREFNKLEICHLSPEAMVDSDDETMKKRCWELCIESGEWKRKISAGGCRNFMDSFHTNPQFRVEIVDPDEEDDEDKGTIIVGLMQKDVRKLTKGGDFLTIGYAIYKLKSPDVPPLDQRFFRFNRQVDKSPSFINQREVCGRHKLTPGHYVIVPSTFNPDEEAEFILRIFSEKPNESQALDSSNTMEDVVQSVYGRKNQSSVMENEEPLRNAFGEFSGPSGRIHAKQLLQILNRSFCRDIKEFQGFSLEACRSMLALVDANMSGFMEFDEFKLLLNEIRLLKTIFKDYDNDGNGFFDAFELREALRIAGYNLSNKVFEAIAMRYMDPEAGTVCFEDFILLAIRLKIAFETFDAMPKTKEDFGVIRNDHFLLQTLYL